MDNLKIITRLRDLVDKFKQKEMDLYDAMRNGDFEDPVFESIDKLVLQIKEEIAHYDILRVDDLSLRNDLTAIRENKEFLYFKMLEIVKKYDDARNADKLTFAPNWKEFYENKWDDILHDEILARVNPYTLVMRRMEMGPLLVGRDVPNHLKMHLIRIKECYAWGFSTEAAIYCRTILEEGFREALKSRVSREERKRLKKWTLDWLLRESEQNRYFYKEVIDRGHNVRENVNKIVHPHAKEPKVKMSDVQIIKDTFYILEMLFR